MKEEHLIMLLTKLKSGQLSLKELVELDTVIESDREGKRLRVALDTMVENIVHGLPPSAANEYSIRWY